MKKIIIIAGPNGAGKTTFAKEFLPQEAECPRFLNADKIAEGLSPFAPISPIKAGRYMLQEINTYVTSGESFAFETTLSGIVYLQHIPQWQTLGFHVSLFYLALPNADMAVERVRERVRQGGHHILEETIRRRFISSRRNFDQRYKYAVDDWMLYDNSGRSPLLIEWGEKS